MIDALYIFFINGQLLIQRNYRNVTRKNDLSHYINKYIKTKRFFEHPIIEINNVFFLNVSINEIVITVLTRSNSNICLIFNFIYKFIEILNYFFNNEISGINIVNNFVLIYEICDEIIDYGYPQTLEVNILKNSLLNKVKYYSRTSKYFQKLSNELRNPNCVIEDIVHDTNIQNQNEGLHMKYYNGNSKDSYKKSSLKNTNSYELNEKNKLKYIGKETLNRIKNKIINNTKPTNNFNYITGNCTWRNNNIYYKKNEIYIDILEILNVTINSNNLIYAHINGKVTLKCFLSGMPICELSTNNRINLLNNVGNASSGNNPSGGNNHPNNAASANSGSKNAGKGKFNQSNSKRKSTSEEKETDDIIIDNCIFHHCVTLSKYENSKLITFTPPDGTFELMKYTITKNIQIPFHIIAIYNPILQYSKSLERKFSLKKLTNNSKSVYGDYKNTNRYEYAVTIKSNYKGSMHATDVVIKIPIYKFSENVEVKYKSTGKTEFNNIEGIVTWRIKKFSSSSEHSIKIYLTLENQNQIYSNMNNTQKVDDLSKVVLQVHKVKNMNTVKFLNTYKMPITLSFKIPMFTSSGMYIRYLKVFEKSNYKIIKWIKYLTESGIYQYK
ncbi:AP-2 complex subunit mu, putative [Plasmodium vivax]|uniref:AP-2 complex subunit mu, putative n=5 Tax=Plasmodium vivax TaxID=5855 RepID=A0A1G4HKJ0_PLAVI|nr:clathrin coat assembly protein AP50 [Plasmodium vivax India VII]KMZ84442.1 clathrin coat assembly protein AP50 [Plasmodium vivax Brazil I]KMZ90222.1 clathrin coat assembly protein AP50 [Plasmodium vivax Mauritania I]KMZ96932.1 clathrin coat assembly protein AP50 [Plasmodium vivax North Korean]CAI7723526.1 AP-2 complex subunit mu, putative [Plasmodium vivax]